MSISSAKKAAKKALNQVKNEIKSFFDRDDVKDTISTLENKWNSLEEKASKFFKNEVKPEFKEAHSNAKEAVNKLLHCKAENKCHDNFQEECSKTFKVIDDLSSTISNEMSGESTTGSDL